MSSSKPPLMVSNVPYRPTPNEGAEGLPGWCMLVITVFSNLNAHGVGVFFLHFLGLLLPLIRVMVRVSVDDSGSGSDSGSSDVQEIPAPVNLIKGGVKTAGGQNGGAVKVSGAAAASSSPSAAVKVTPRAATVASTASAAEPEDVMRRNPGWQVGQVVEAHSLSRAPELNGARLEVVARDAANAPTMTLDRVPVRQLATHGKSSSTPVNLQEVCS